MALEVIWPRHKWDYLNVADPDIPVDPPLLPSTWTDPERSVSASLDIGGSNGASVSRGSQKRQRTRRQKSRERSAVAVGITSQPGRTLAVHAFLHGAQCDDRRAGELLGVCRQTAGRDRARPPVTTPPVLERAQTLIAASADRGSTPEERTAAAAWLTTGATPACDGAEFNARVGCMHTPNPSKAPVEAPMDASLTRDQVDACGRLHRRIRVRTDAIRRLLEPEAARDDLTEVVLDLLIDIRGATEALEALLQDVRPGHAPAA